MIWTIWSRFKDLNGRTTDISVPKRSELFLTDQERPADCQSFMENCAIQDFLEEKAKEKGYPFKRLEFESFTDEWFCYTLDKKTKRRRLFIHLVAGIGTA